MLLTIGITLQIKTINNIGTTIGSSETINDLKSAVLKQKEKYDNLLEKIENMEKQLEDAREGATKNNAELAELENTIKEANKAAGLSEVTGNGVKIILNDNQTISPNSWYGDPNWLIVHDLDIINVVNELKNAGAEAISINDQRIVSTTAITCSGNVIRVNGEKIGAPFTIKAIGFQEVLMGLNRFGRISNEYERKQIFNSRNY